MQPQTRVAKQVGNFPQLLHLACRGSAVLGVQAVGAVLRAAVACLWDHPALAHGPTKHKLMRH